MYQIFVVEDELLIRQNIRGVIENMAGPYAFCGEASDGEMALSMMQDLMPDILLTDIKMPFLDGFELIRHVKAMMPWLKIIIISGYGEFESAQKAIALGVDLYLLKPVRSHELVEAIEKMAGQIAESKLQTALPSGYDKDELRRALHQHFMRQLLGGGASTARLLEQARFLDIDLVHPLYQPLLFYFDHEDAPAQGFAAIITGILSDKQLPLHAFSAPDRLTLLLCGATKEALSEETYRFINIIRHELKDTGVIVTTVVGNLAGRISAIRDAYAAADAMLKKVHSPLAGQVVDVNDTAQITADIVSFSSPFGEAFQQKLLYATEQDVPALLAAYLGGANANQFGSMLFRYYTLVDLLKIAVQIVSGADAAADPKDIAARFSAEYDIFAASSRRELFENMAHTLLKEAVRMKRDNLGFLRHSHVISRAEEYVRQNFCDPNISLISVARHVGMSAAHLSTLFSQTIGKSFIAYLTQLRIERAKELLTHSDMKIATIAMEIGYNEPNYFSHVFKKSEDITPKEYRLRAGKP
ncbi:MAG: response regulator [Oscillospiraceae bacterium]|jgi:two-component system response regulator YesN|nr:response regulator [Oscillospiraceae bacterium]